MSQTTGADHQHAPAQDIGLDRPTGYHAQLPAANPRRRRVPHATVPTQHDVDPPRDDRATRQNSLDLIRMIRSQFTAAPDPEPATVAFSIESQGECRPSDTEEEKIALPQRSLESVHRGATQHRLAEARRPRIGMRRGARVRILPPRASQKPNSFGHRGNHLQSRTASLYTPVDCLMTPTPDGAPYLASRTRFETSNIKPVHERPSTFLPNFRQT